MIDFRYHIVSIVAIFFALGAGVVLGAGPLKGTGSELVASQAEKDRQQLADTTQRQIVAEDAKAGHRSTACTGHLGDPASPGWIRDVDLDRREIHLPQCSDEGGMPC